MDWFQHDLRHSIRRLIRRPGMSALAVLTLAVGLGVNTVAFSAINALIFKPFHIPNADKIGWLLFAGTNDASVNVTVSDFEALERRTGTLDIVVASARAPLAQTDADSTRQIWAMVVSPRFFEMLPPSLVSGRGLVAADSASNAGSDEVTAVVSERFWRSHLGGNPDLNALHLELNRRPARIVGVMKDGYETPTGVFEPDLWMPMTAGQRLGVLNAGTDLDASVGILAMPRPDTPVTAIVEDVRRILADQLAMPASNIRVSYGRILDGHPETRALKPVAAIALAAVGIVLLIACFNVAGLLLAQSAERQREMGMRAALGASRSRLIRQLVTDGAVLATLAGTAAVILAGWSAALLSTFSLPAPIPQRLHFVTDWRLISFAIALSLVAALLPALVPAFQVWRADLTGWIRASSAGGSGGRGQARARRAFMVLQVAGSTVFVIASAVFGASFIRARSINPGFDTVHTAVLELDPAHYGYTTARTRELAGSLTRRLELIPDVVSASAADRIPFSMGYPISTTVSLNGRDCRTGGCPSVGVYAVDGHHAAAMGLTLRAGRMFDSTSAADRDAVVISQAAADTLWPDALPLGQTFRDSGGRVRRVVGILNDVTTNLMNATARPQPSLYWPLEDANYGHPLTVVVRTSGAPDVMVETMRRALHDIAPAVPPQSIGTMRQRLALPLWPTRTLAGFFGVCGLLALLLATVGLFGVTHYVVSQRTREFGVRLAIGASGGALQRMVLGESLRLIAPGVVIGLAAGAALSTLVKSQLVGLGRPDPRIFAAAVAIEIVVALAAAWMPARRAARTNPLLALRAD